MTKPDSSQTREVSARYAVHPGFIISKHDRQRHYIGFRDLVRHFKVSSADCIVWDESDPRTTHGRQWTDYVHLFPDYHGRYEVPK